MLASAIGSGPTSTSYGGESTAARIATLPSAPTPAQGASGLRPAVPHDSRFLTVEPDGRDDVSFMDRLRHALRGILEAVHRPQEAEQAAERALQAAADTLDAAAAAGDDHFVQLRIVGIETAYTEGAGGGESAYASIRHLGIEIGVARAGAVRAEDTTVVGLDGNSLGLAPAQLRAGLASGTYRRVEIAPAADSGKAADRLAAAQAGLARVKAMQDALHAYRDGDVEPLKRLFEAGDHPAAGRPAAVFPGIGALAFN